MGVNCLALGTNLIIFFPKLTCCLFVCCCVCCCGCVLCLFFVVVTFHLVYLLHCCLCCPFPCFHQQTKMSKRKPEMQLTQDNYESVEASIGQSNSATFQTASASVLAARKYHFYSRSIVLFTKLTLFVGSFEHEGENLT